MRNEAGTLAPRAAHAVGLAIGPPGSGGQALTRAAAARGHLWMWLAVVGLVLGLPADIGAACALPDRVILAEVFYDAIGDDSDLEFVELFNPTTHAIELAGLRLEAGDGAGPGRWSLRWTGTAADSLAPGERFVIGGAGVHPAPTVHATLSLQNGPDAVRLKWPDGAIEVLGYGAVPDSADLGTNALDFRPAPPSPGRANQPRRDLALVPGSLTLEPARPRVNQSTLLRGRVINRGVEPLATAAATLVVWRHDGDAGSELLRVPLPQSLGSGDSASFVLALPGLPAGHPTLEVEAVWPGDEDPDDGRDSLRVRVGEGPLRLSELQFHPAHGEGEWIEVLAWDFGTVSLEGFGIADRSGTHATLAADGDRLASGQRALFVQARAVYLTAHPALDSTRVFQLSPWPALNNSDDATGVADILMLLEPDGTLGDALAYSAAGVPTGVPLERSGDDRWQPAGDPEGTPLEPPRVLPALGTRFAARPARIASGGRTRLDWSLPWEWAQVSVQGFDLAGRSLGSVLAESLRRGRGGVEWSVDRWPAGLCLLVLRARPERGDEWITATAAVRIEGQRP